MNQYEQYGKIAQTEADFSVQNGRYPIQANAEKLIPEDVAAKLNIQSKDHILDIGCGAGTNLIPLSANAAHITGIDHQNVISRLKNHISATNITLIAGDFLKTPLEQRYSKIILYSVIHCLPDQKSVYTLLDKALQVLDPAGMFLIGDIPNIDKKKRFLNSSRGQTFQKEWEKQSEEQNHDQDDYLELLYNPDLVQIDDKFMSNIIETIHDKGYEAYITPQPQDLPFGNTREDIIIIGSEYQSPSRI